MKHIKHISKAYLALLGIFAIILAVGSVKGTAFPDETVYTPGKLVAAYNPTTETFFRPAQMTEFMVTPQTLQASTIGNPNCQ